MTATSYIYFPTSNAPLKMWTEGIEVEEGALAQLYKLAQLPFIHSHIAVMPDVHRGIGATIGSVIPPKTPSSRDIGHRSETVRCSAAGWFAVGARCCLCVDCPSHKPSGSPGGQLYCLFSTGYRPPTAG